MTIHVIHHPASGAWARMAVDGRTARIDYDGPSGRNLWAERPGLLDCWEQAGRPPVERYGLTVGADGTHALWLDSPGGSSWVLPS
ncbi:hypothetical protein [Streptomyces axinellae]|uniref:hypothetical protein n=1 Tax=Streptomyces axinellae TaxID=552788 RepID=UPI0031D451E3